MISITSSSLALLLSVLLYGIYRRYSSISVKHIRGPKASFWKGQSGSDSRYKQYIHIILCWISTGNVRDFSYQTNVGDLDFQYAKEYGLVWRMGSALGVRPGFRSSAERFLMRGR